MNDLNLAVKLSLKNDAFIAQMRASEAEARKFGQQVSKSLSGTDAGWAKLSAQGREAMAVLASREKASAQWAALSKQGLEQVSAKTVQFTADTSAAEKGINQLSTAFATAAKAAIGLYAVGAAAAFSRDVVQAALSADKLRASLGAVFGVNAQQEFDYVRQAANRLGIEVNGTADAYLKFAASSKGTALEGQQTRDIFESVAGAMARLGRSGPETEGALLAVSQMMSKGTVSAEELRGQLGERLPGAFGIMARALGVTTAELSKMLEQGQVGLDVLPRFAEELNRAFGTGPITSMQSHINRLSNAWQEFLTNVSNLAPLNAAIGKLADLARAANEIRAENRAAGVVGNYNLEGTRQIPVAEREKLYDELFAQYLETQNGTDAQSVRADMLRRQMRVIETARTFDAQDQLRSSADAESQLFDQVTAAQTRSLAPVKPQKIEYDRPRAAAIADYLESRGLTPIQVAGIVGNLAQEAPGGQGSFGTSLAGDQGSVGIAQWRLERKDALLNFAQRSGTPPTDLKTQLDFLLTEARQRGDLDALRQARSPEQAAKIFADRFERPKPETANYEYRATVAADVYDRSALDRLRVSGRSTRTTDRITTEDETRLTEELTRIESERTEKIVQQREEVRRRTVETYDQMLSDLQQASEEENQILVEKQTYQRTLEARTEAEFERRQTAQLTFLDEAYKEKLLSSQDYYAKLQALADEDLNRKLAAIDRELQAETEKQAKLQALIDAQRARNLPTIDAEAELIRSSTRKVELETQRDTANATYRTTSQKLTVDATSAQSSGTGDTNALQEFVTQYNAGLGSMQQYTFTAVSGMQNALSDFFETGMQGTESMGASFAKMARSIAADIAAMMITKGIVSFLGMIAGGVGGGVLSAGDAAAVGAIGTPGPTFPGAGLAAGGMVETGLMGTSGRAPGLFDLTPRTDVPQFAAGGLVPVRVSAGEGYLPPATVQSVGVPKLEQLNELSRSAVPPVREMAATTAAFGVASPVIHGLSVFSGPGTGTSDSIPALLPEGSFVLRESAMQTLTRRVLSGSSPTPQFTAGGEVAAPSFNMTVRPAMLPSARPQIWPSMPRPERPTLLAAGGFVVPVPTRFADGGPVTPEFLMPDRPDAVTRAAPPLAPLPPLAEATALRPMMPAARFAAGGDVSSPSFDLTVRPSMLPAAQALPLPRPGGVPHPALFATGGFMVPAPPRFAAGGKVPIQVPVRPAQMSHAASDFTPPRLATGGAAPAGLPFGPIPGLQTFVGPGTGTSDSIPSLLPEGSFVLREAAMRALSLNPELPRLAAGGMVPVLVSNGEGYVPPPVVQSVGVRALDRINALGAGLGRYAVGGVVGAMPEIDGGSSSGLSIDMPLTFNVAGSGKDGGGFSSDRAAQVKRELTNAVQSAVMDMKRPGGPLWSGRG